MNNESVFRKINVFIIVGLLMLCTGFGGYIVGKNGYEIALKKEVIPVEIINRNASMGPNSIDFARFWIVWEEINRTHIRRPLDPRVLLNGAIQGMVGAVEDPYTTYLNVELNKEAKDSLNGKYEGIGAQLGFDDAERLIVVAPLDGSPAQKVGVRAGDKILQIEGQPTIGISVTEAVSKIRGTAGTVSTLMLARADIEEPFEVKIIRDTIKLESVKWEDKGDGIAYLRLSRFGETTDAEWTEAVNEITLQMPNLKGIILDVRNNPGGFLDSAVFIASEFIDSGIVVTQEFSDGTANKFNVNHKGKLTANNVDLAVLVNEGSASASEIVAAALKESRGAVIVGKRSFGKGSVQKSEEYPEGAALHVTIAKWLTPNNNWLDAANSKFTDSVYNEKLEDGKEIVGGIKPDFVVEITDEDITNAYDRQLEESIRILKEGVSTEDSLINKIQEFLPVGL